MRNMDGHRVDFSVLRVTFIVIFCGVVLNGSELVSLARDMPIIRELIRSMKKYIAVLVRDYTTDVREPANRSATCP